MTALSFRDVEQLSAYLDGQLSLAERARLESRLETDPNLSTALEDLRATRATLRRTPQRRAPRNFTLTHKMAGIKPPLPRAVPVFRLASVVATILLFFTFAGNLVTPLAAAPKLAAAPFDMEAGVAEQAPAPFAAEELALSPTPESMTLLTPEATPEPGARPLEQPSPPTETPPAPVFKLSWLQIALLALAVILGGSAFLIRWQTYRAFAKNMKRKSLRSTYYVVRIT